MSAACAPAWPGSRPSADSTASIAPAATACACLASSGSLAKLPGATLVQSSPRASTVAAPSSDAPLLLPSTRVTCSTFHSTEPAMERMSCGQPLSWRGVVTWRGRDAPTSRFLVLFLEKTA